MFDEFHDQVLGYPCPIHSSPHSLTLHDVTDRPRRTENLDNARQDGRNDGAALVPAGTNYLVLIVTNSSAESMTASGDPLTVSLKRLVARTWTKKVTAGGSTKQVFAGRCSQVRRPGLALGSGSVGYYSKSKCTGSTNNADVAATLNGVTLPAVTSPGKPGKVTVSAYGRSQKGGSKAVLLFLTKAGAADTANARLLGGALGWHAGPTVSASGYQTSSRQLRWSAGAAGGWRYDIKYFKVVYHYTALV